MRDKQKRRLKREKRDGAADRCKGDRQREVGRLQPVEK